MSNLIVVYKSKYGSTEKYAYEIKEKTNGDICKLKDVNSIDFDKYDIVIYGGRVFAGTIDGLSNFVKKFEDKLKNKKFLIFGVGCSSIDSIEKINKLKQVSKPENLEAEIFYFRGALDSRKLGFMDKLMIKMVKSKAMKTPENERDDDERAIIDSFERKVDFFDKRAVDGLIERIK